MEPIEWEWEREEYPRSIVKREFKVSFQVYSVRRRGGVGEVTAATVTGVETKRELGSSTLPLLGSTFQGGHLDVWLQ